MIHSLVMFGLLVGCGSIGKRHFKELLNYVEKVVVVDPNPSILQFLQPYQEKFIYFANIDELRNSTEFSKTHFDIVVLANWAPDRKNTLVALDQLRYARILIEKPVASSLQDVEWISNYLKLRRVSAAVNFHLRTSRLPEIISSLNSEFELGPILKIIEMGGAKCFSTNGVHWLDFAMYLFKCQPHFVSASNHFSKINPRSDSLNFVDGNSIWEFSDERSFQISYSNYSSFPSRLSILYPHALLSFAAGKLTLELQSIRSNLSRVPITRTTEPEKKIEISGSLNWPNGEDGISKLYGKIFSAHCDIEDYLNSTRVLLHSFMVSKRGTSVPIPDNWQAAEVFNDNHFTTDWLVT